MNFNARKSSPGMIRASSNCPITGIKSGIKSKGMKKYLIANHKKILDITGVLLSLYKET